MSQLDERLQKALAFLDRYGPLSSFNISLEGRGDFDDLVELGLAVKTNGERYGLLTDGSYGKRMDYVNYHVTDEGKAVLSPEKKPLPPVNPNLVIAAKIIDEQRFAGMDQNPKGVRDLLGSAVEKDRRMGEALRLAYKALSDGESSKDEALRAVSAVLADWQGQVHV